MKTPARIEIVAHSSSSYVPRTRENAETADLTIAVAADFSTAGERLTKRSAGEKYLALPITEDPVVSARRLYSALKSRGFLDGQRRPVLNVAGNGVYTLLEHGIDQEAANAHLFAMFSAMQPHLPLGRIISGGQTGIDFAGAVAGHALGLRVRMTLPAGFIQRGPDHTDCPQDPEDLRAAVISQAEALTMSR
jgi:hypothetical protein